jgi:hypothetical protein
MENVEKAITAFFQGRSPVGVGRGPRFGFFFLFNEELQQQAFRYMRGENIVMQY